MAHKMVRQPSETPNISNIDDIIPFRYAYGNQDGYVINKGTELSYTINGREFRINSGRVVLQGVEDDIDANGVSFTIDNISTTRYYVVYFRVNLSNNTTSYELTYDTAGYPTIDIGDDLTKYSSGSSNLPIYRFKATSGVISEVEKVAKAIEYSGRALVGYNINKGTVEERLTRLGFRQDNITDINGNIVGYIKREGNYVIGSIDPTLANSDINQLKEEFRPKEYIYFGCKGKLLVSANGTFNGTKTQTGGSLPIVSFSTTGDVVFSSADVSVSETSGSYRGYAYAGARNLEICNFGYEANPIE